MEQAIYIYALCDPRKPKRIRYIGQTHDVFGRHLQHCASFRGTAKCLWIKSLRDKGIFPQITVLEITTKARADKRERKWIKENAEHLTNKLFQGEELPVDLNSTLAAFEKKHIHEALAATGFNMKQTARKLGIGRQTLYNKVHEYKIQKS